MRNYKKIFDLFLTNQQKKNEKKNCRKSWSGLKPYQLSFPLVRIFFLL